MRIAYVSAAMVPSRTASSVQVMKMSEAFTMAGHDVVLFARHGAEPVDDAFRFYGVAERFRIIFCHWPPLGPLGRAVYCRDVLREVRAAIPPDLVYGRYLYALATLAPLGWPIVYEVHDLPHNYVKAVVEDWLFRHSSFRRLVAISAALRDEYLRRFPTLPSEAVLVAPSGAELPDQPTPNGRGNESGEERRFRVGYVGHLYPGKGMEVIVAAAQRLRDLEFHVIGGTDVDIERWRAAGTPGNLRFHGFVPHAAVGALMAGFDVVVAPYQRLVAVSGGSGDVARWMSPLKIFEYMASGKAIVCSDLPVLREILQHQRNALLVPPNDVDAWVAALRLLLANDELRERLGVNANRDLVDLYTWGARAQRVLR